jgi:hypothetical protein
LPPQGSEEERLAGERIDAVYTWVDGAWPGYPELLSRYAQQPVDLNPNRYRDNLDLLRYSLRSLQEHAPWLGEVVLVTERPQVPRWLRTDAPGLRVVHHDAILDAADLPTFSSFVIESALHRIPGLSRRFVYINDDMLLGRPVQPSDLWLRDGRAIVYLEWRRAGAELAHHPHPYEAATGVANVLLDRRFGRRARGRVRHVPLPMDQDHWRALEAEFPEALAATRRSRFRSQGTVTPDQLYPLFCLEAGYSVAAPLHVSYRKAAYLGLENLPRWMRVALAALRLWRPAFLCLNDGFGEHPDPGVVAELHRFLEALWPRPSRFEAA